MSRWKMAIDAQLSADTHPIGAFDCSRVLLHRNATIPWMILVPDCGTSEFLALAPSLRERLLAESAQTADFIRTHFGSSKINFAVIGNIVPQLHLHIVGRDPRDDCWPAPVWGNRLKFKCYADHELDSVIAAMGTVIRRTEPYAGGQQ